LCSSFNTLSAFTYATLQPCRAFIEISLSISVCMKQLKNFYMDFRHI
jgi:hypothetical protein